MVKGCSFSNKQKKTSLKLECFNIYRDKATDFSDSRVITYAIAEKPSGFIHGGKRGHQPWQCNVANINHCTVWDTVEHEVVDIYTGSSGRQWSALDTEGGCEGRTATLYRHPMFWQKICNVISHILCLWWSWTRKDKTMGYNALHNLQQWKKVCGALRRESEANCEEEINMTNSLLTKSFWNVKK